MVLSLCDNHTVKVHVNSAKQKKMVTARKASRCIDNFILKKDTKEDISVVNSEIGLVYHNYFDSKKGICQKLLDFYEDADEKSNEIYQCLKTITSGAGLSINQISAYGADNAPFALKGFDVDVESIVIKIYNEFSSSALKTKKLKECLEFAQIEYKELLRHVATRWLSLLPAIERLTYACS
ncbi:hypothetical protein HHI36_021610 [Cryptolaemus montrouzieri]|uniref:Uncharacterized protein n=1 Tax=Cryptolaemus montrouzieri TaxID=559131 RepID=A0ABD2MY36_9CUCU